MPRGREVAAPGVVRVVLVVLTAHLIFVAVRVLALGGADGFVTYDGRAYYRLALDPLTLAVSDHGITFTRPAYWQARIGYPAVARAVSLGRDDLVPAALVAVNLAAVAGIALVASRAALGWGRNAWWGAIPAMWAGFLVGLGQDLTEPLAGLLLLGALLLARAGRHGLAAVALTAAGLTRETTLVVAVAVLAAALLPRRGESTRRGAPPWWVGVIPLVAYAGWRAWVRSRWSDVVPDAPSDNPLGAPGLELARYLGSAVAHPLAEVPHLALLVPTLLTLGLAATGLRGGGPLHERLALAAYLLLLVSLPVWDRGQAYLRWGCEPFLLGWLLLASRSAGRSLRVERPLAFTVTVVWLITATQSVAYPVATGPWSGWWTWS